MSTKIILIISILLAISGLEQAKAQETQPDTVWVRWTHDITRLEFSNDDSKILTVGSGGIIIFDTQTGNQIKQLPCGDAFYHSTGNILLLRQMRDSINRIISYDINEYNPITYDLLKTVSYSQLANSDYAKFAISPDGLNIAIVTRNGLYFIDYLTGLIKKDLGYKSDGQGNRLGLISNFLFSKDSKYFIYTSSDEPKGENTCLNFMNMESYVVDFRTSNGEKQLCISDDGSLIAFNSTESGKAVSIMNTQTHEIINSIPGNPGGVTSIAFSPDNLNIAVSWLDKVDIYIYRVIDGENTNVIRSGADGTGGFDPIDISNNSQYIAAGAGPILLLFNFITTGNQELDDNMEFLYPNPTNDFVILNFELNTHTLLNFNLYDMFGNQMSNLHNAFYSPGQITENLSLGNLSNGSYFLKIESLQFNKIFKIIINK